MYRVEICYNSEKSKHRDVWIKAFLPETLVEQEDYVILEDCIRWYNIVKTKWLDYFKDLRIRKPLYLPTEEYIKGVRIREIETSKIVY